MRFEVGDRVIDIRFGEGTVSEIEAHVEYPVKVTFDNNEWDEYMLDGRAFKNSPYPSLYYVESFTPPSCKEPERKPKCEFKPFDKVLVRDRKSEIWNPHFFSNHDENMDYPYHMIQGGYWKYCIPYEGNEDKCGRA